MIGNLPWASARSTVANQKLSGPSYRCASGGRGSFQVGQTAKARSGYRVQSLRKGLDRQCRTYVNKDPPLKVVTIARLMDATDAVLVSIGL
jgi:hypothetical protein